jgi:hypothetical protein
MSDSREAAHRVIHILIKHAHVTGEHGRPTFEDYSSAGPMAIAKIVLPGPESQRITSDNPAVAITYDEGSTTTTCPSKAFPLPSEGSHDHILAAI